MENDFKMDTKTYFYEYFLILKKYFRSILEILISYLAITGALILKDPGVYFLGMLAQVMIAIWSMFIMGNFVVDIIKLHKKDKKFRILKTIINFFLVIYLLHFFIGINIIGRDTIDLAYKIDIKNYINEIQKKDYKIDERLKNLKNPFE
ncbi:hypothetical protein DLH72_04735 [Candidatus Gracilibacteria bacterium]|nr:MAG: hypothetical protein DLH72_04735 [Candidatus Gracilibacteria bacterium]